MREVIDLINIKQKQLRDMKAHSIKTSIFIGSQVRIKSKKGVEFGEVTKINRTKAVVKIDGKLWNCPLAMLEAA
jgi:hypothetical protein